MSTCHLCGWRDREPTWFGAMIAVCARKGGAYKKAPRWPHRRRAAMRCPECGELIELVCALSRDCLVLNGVAK